MKENEKIGLLAEIFEVESDSLSVETRLESLKWDSMAYLSLIAIVNEHFGKKISAQQLKSFVTIGDLLTVME
jgi:acyl carrier protein